MKTSLLIIFALGGILLFIPHNAYACSCTGYPDYLLTFMESKAAFQGKVTKIIQNDSGYEEVYFDITFPQKEIYHYDEYVTEQYRGNSCAVDYKIGEIYQVFTYPFSGMMGETGICSTKQITGFNEYSHEDENGQIEHYREDYNILTQYNLGTIIIPLLIAIIIPSFIVWRKRK